MQVPWDLDISKLEGEEIRVEILDKFPIPTSISHNFVSYEGLFIRALVDIQSIKTCIHCV